MNVWLCASSILVLATLLCGFVAMRKGLEDRIASLQLASSVGTLALLLAAQGYGRSIYADVAITLAILTFGGSLALARFTERWL